MIESIKYAEKIQKSILTEESVLAAVVDEVMVYYRPLDIVSGDFYVFKKVGNKFIISFFDCTGHGVPGAILSMLGSSILDSLIGKGIIKPSELLISLNNEIYRRLNASGKTNDGMEGGIVVINQDTGKLTYSGAKADMVYFSDGKLERVKGNRISLGEEYLSEEVTLDQVFLETNELSSFYLFSDGFKDQIGESGTEKYNTRRFNELLNNIHMLDASDQVKSLDQELLKWKGESDQVDDIMVLGFKTQTR